MPDETIVLTDEQTDEVNYGKHLLWRMVGATVTALGGNEKGEIFLSTVKDGVSQEVIFAIDEKTGEIALYEVERREVPA